MGRGLLKKLTGSVTGETQPKPVESETYIDLGAIEFEDEPRPGGKLVIKVAELHRQEDLADLLNLVYTGNIVLLDFSLVASDDLAMRRISNEIKNVTRDTGGDAAGVAKNMLMITPGGVSIDRKVIRGPV
jgi:SepF-like predicted cell division protein (DUF552 family)